MIPELEDDSSVAMIEKNTTPRENSIRTIMKLITNDKVRAGKW